MVEDSSFDMFLRKNDHVPLVLHQYLIYRIVGTRSSLNLIMPASREWLAAL